MTVIEEIYEKLMSSCQQLSTRFTTADIIKIFSERYPEDWALLEENYGKGGKGSGQYYTCNSYIGLMLRNLSKSGKIQSLDFTDAPKEWGNPEISYYQNWT